MKLILGLLLALPLACFANEPVAVWVHPAGDWIELFGDRGTKCPDQTQRATYFISDPRANGAVIEGCWTLADGDRLICMAFEDGDQGCLLKKDFKWSAGTP